MSSNVIVIDANMLQQLYAAGGSRAWNTLFNAGDKIIITSIIHAEALASPYGAKFDSWYTNNIAKFEFRSVTLDQINARYGTHYSIEITVTVC